MFHLHAVECLYKSEWDHIVYPGGLLRHPGSWISLIIQPFTHGVGFMASDHWSRSGSGVGVE